MTQTTVPFYDLQKINAPFLEEIRCQFDQIMSESRFLLGKWAQKFEREFATACRAKHAVGVNSGLDALTLLLRALVIRGDLREGDRIGVPANTFIATFLSAQQAGLRPIPLDVRTDSHCLDPEVLEKDIVNHTLRAIVTVHLFGYMPDMDAMTALCSKHGTLLIEDAAQAHLAEWNGKPAGAWGAGAAFSFYPGKNLGAFGDAGCITTQDDELAGLCRQLRNYGSAQKYKHELLGVNSRLDELQAAVLSVKLKHLATENEARRSVASRYFTGISNPALILPNRARDMAGNMVFHQFVLRSDDRDALQRHLERQGVHTLIHYPSPAYRQDCFGELYSHFDCPNADLLSKQVLSLPINSALSIEQVQQVVDACNAFTGER
jgi:dTDP-4-amino-4,6-dideoxygalactose transaminase